eukprot:gene47808-58570_t
MAISRTLLRSTALFERSPAGCLRRLNDLLAVGNEQMLFVTVFYGVVDLQTGRVSYVNAGHNLPYRVSRAGELSTLPSTKGMAVAVMEGFVYAEHHLQLEPGDTLFLFTDGVTEAFDIDEQAYGERRLEALLSQGAAGWPVPAGPSVWRSIRPTGQPQALGNQRLERVRDPGRVQVEHQPVLVGRHRGQRKHLRPDGVFQ